MGRPSALTPSRSQATDIRGAACAATAGSAVLGGGVWAGATGTIESSKPAHSAPAAVAFCPFPVLPSGAEWPDNHTPRKEKVKFSARRIQPGSSARHGRSVRDLHRD
jgi:hypothetical protein